jgi:integrase
LIPEQGRRLLAHADVATPRALRNRAMLAMLIGCGRRRSELLAVTLESIQQREGRWVVADLVGKGRQVRAVPIPTSVKTAVDEWTITAGITNGVVFRAINRMGRVWGNGNIRPSRLGRTYPLRCAGDLDGVMRVGLVRFQGACVFQHAPMTISSCRHSSTGPSGVMLRAWQGRP